MKTVVILLSDKRSGSTMFQDALCRHPKIRTVDYSPHTYLETHHWLKGTVMLDLPAKRSPESGCYRGYGSKTNARTYMIDCIQGNLPDFIPPISDRELIFQGWEALCEKFATPVFFEKSPQYLGFPASLDLLLEWARETEFSVKFIGLTRNPLSVQYSAWQLFHRDPTDRQYGWMELQEEMLSIANQLPPDQFMHVNYETLIDASEATFARICHFIGIDPHPDVSQAIHDKSLSKWKDDPYFQLQLAPEVKALAKQFGYSDSELENPEKPSPPWHWQLRQKATGCYQLSRAKLMDRFIKPIQLRRRHTKASK